MKVAFNNLVFSGLKDSARSQLVYETLRKASANYLNSLTSLNFSVDKNTQNGKLSVQNLNFKLTEESNETNEQNQLKFPQSR